MYLDVGWTCGGETHSQKNYEYTTNHNHRPHNDWVVNVRQSWRSFSGSEGPLQLPPPLCRASNLTLGWEARGMGLWKSFGIISNNTVYETCHTSLCSDPHWLTVLDVGTKWDTRLSITGLDITWQHQWSPACNMNTHLVNLGLHKCTLRLAHLTNK